MVKEDPYVPDSSVKSSANVDNATLKAIGMSDKEIQRWQNLRKQYLTKNVVKWGSVTAPEKSFFSEYDSFPAPDEKQLKDFLSKLVIIKLNGGLGSRMGAKGPKSAIEVSGGQSFLDLTVRHVEYLNSQHGTDIPLVLMNSFTTDADTKKIIQKYSSSSVTIHTFQQSKFPRFYKDTMFPVPKPNKESKDWYPPGSGDVFDSFKDSGLLESFIKAGKEYIFISNAENLGAVVDNKILKHVFDSKVEFALEVTDRISTDLVGGMPVKYDGKIHVLEYGQIPDNKHRDFSCAKFKFWNTNNIYANLGALQAKLQGDAHLEMDFVVTNVVGTRNQVQLETPAGMSIQNFKAEAIHVPRIRYRGVKSTSQLLLAQSNIFRFENGELIMDPKRVPATSPLVKLGEEFSAVSEYQKRIPNIPNIMELEHLTVSGDVWFGSGITLKGTIIICANHGERIDIPDGCVIENKIVSGNLRILEH